jgi:hypothetical protein
MLQIQNFRFSLAQAKQANATSTEIPMEKPSTSICYDNTRLMVWAAPPERHRIVPCWCCEKANNGEEPST